MKRTFTRRRVLQLAGATGAALTAAALAEKESLFAHHIDPVKQPIVLLRNSTLAPSTVAQENQRAGTTDWEIAPHTDTTFICGYAGQVSASPGETVPLYISSVTPSGYRVDVYRIGWYGGLGGRLHFSQPQLTSPAQGYWSTETGLVASPTTLYDPQTKLIDVNWQPAFALPIGHDWVSGMYLIKLTAENNSQSYIPLVVRAPTDRAAILVGFPVNTYQAYNIWGGSSLYQLAGKPMIIETDSAQKATKVSFNRPYERSAGAGDFLAWDIHTVRWLEREGFDVAYTTNVDMAAQPNALLQHRVFLSTGHDEYWTKSMRDGAETARDQGVSLAFFGANAAYWQARLEPDSAGNPHRTLVCYKVETRAQSPAGDLSQDPLYLQQPELVTARWRDPFINRPENALLGLMYSSFFIYFKNQQYYLPDWIVNETTGDNLIVVSGLTPGQHIAGGLLGYEYDRVFDNGATPASLVVLAHSPVINNYGTHEFAQSAYYRAASGALVFDAGSIWWSWGLDELSPHAAYQRNLLKGSEPIKALSRNILHAMLIASQAGPTTTPVADPTP